MMLSGGWGLMDRLPNRARGLGFGAGSGMRDPVLSGEGEEWT